MPPNTTIKEKKKKEFGAVSNFHEKLVHSPPFQQ
jgi:hypothetical protein